MECSARVDGERDVTYLVERSDESRITSERLAHELDVLAVNRKERIDVSLGILQKSTAVSIAFRPNVNSRHRPGED